VHVLSWYKCGWICLLWCIESGCSGEIWKLSGWKEETRIRRGVAADCHIWGGKLAASGAPMCIHTYYLTTTSPTCGGLHSSCSCLDLVWERILLLSFFFFFIALPSPAKSLTEVLVVVEGGCNDHCGSSHTIISNTLGGQEQHLAPS
jgi:hypothetical protein